MKITFWGTRGSIPVNGPQFVRHGGSTTCLEIEPGGDVPRHIVDCGTGLAQLGKARGATLKRARFYQTHMHWDHVQGFPFFAPLFNPLASFDFHAVNRQGQTLREVLSAQMSQPTFPVGLDIMPAKMTFNELPEAGRAQHADVSVRWMEVWHPGGSTAYRFEHNGVSVVFTGDVEVQQGGVRELVEFARGADVLIMDAQYLPDEYPSRRGFGHSTPLDAVEVAVEAGVGRLVMTHHDPGHDDRTLENKLAIARAAGGNELIVDNAFDGMTIEVHAGATRALDPREATCTI